MGVAGCSELTGRQVGRSGRRVWRCCVCGLSRLCLGSMRRSDCGICSGVAGSCRRGREAAWGAEDVSSRNRTVVHQVAQGHKPYSKALYSVCSCLIHVFATALYMHLE